MGCQFITWRHSQLASTTNDKVGHVPTQPPGTRTSVSGRSCVCTGLSHRRPSHRARSPGPPLLPHHQFHSYWLQPQNTAAPLDTKEPERRALFATVTHGPTSTCAFTVVQNKGELCTAESLTCFHFFFLLLLLFFFFPALRIEPRPSSMLGCSVSAQALSTPQLSFLFSSINLPSRWDCRLSLSEVFNFIFPVLQTHEFKESTDYT